MNLKKILDKIKKLVFDLNEAKKWFKKTIFFLKA